MRKLKLKRKRKMSSFIKQKKKLLSLVIQSLPKFITLNFNDVNFTDEQKQRIEEFKQKMDKRLIMMPSRYTILPQFGVKDD